ncbi:MAG: LuxR C-terminal-related transcriptional regulator [Actinophytocola sp.]|uniref:LuxR C-terminal-related transcriptional regulator n=1 Tax=Actinophytocola sp. TaxID=1872138 RepID=UPI003C72222D
MSSAPVTGRRGVPRTKLTVPEPPSQLISRPRLLTVLERASDSMVTLVSAPAGAGKTLLLAEWARAHDASRIVWVSLDTDDNEDHRFWSALLDALSGAWPVAEECPLWHLTVPADPSMDPTFLADVANALDDLPAPALLVLDDVHELTDPRPLRGLESLLQRQPARLRLILSTRHDTHLPLARVRLADELSEIRAEDLRFSPDEAQDMLAVTGIRLRSEQFRLLLEQTEGWAAGLRLASLSLSGTIDHAVHDRAVADYLIDEVLLRLSSDLRAFLSAISVCEQTSAELAAHLSGRADAGALLDAIAEQTSLVFRVESTHWYHVHALLRAHVLSELVRQYPGRATQLHGAAAAWFATHDLPALAVDHAAAAGDTAQATTLMHRHALSLALSGEHELVRRVLDMLGGQTVAADSLLSLVSALLHLEQHEPRPADRDLAHAEAAWPPQPPPELVSLRQLVRSRQALDTGDIADFVKVTGGLDSAPGHHLDAPTMFLRGTALLVTGRREAGREQLRAGLATARDAGHDYLATQCLTMLAGLAGMEGDLTAMVTMATAADRENTRHGWHPPVAASAMLAYGALLHAEPAECLRQAHRTVSRGQDSDPIGTSGLHVVVETLRGAAEFELGERIAGARRIHEARTSGNLLRLWPEEVALCAVLEHRTALLLGWSAAAGEALRWADAGIPGTAEIHLMRARTQLSQGRREAAAKTIQPVLTGAISPVMPWSVIDAWLLSCEVALGAGDDPSAQRTLRHALTLAQHLDVLYPVVFAAPDVINLLTTQLGRLGRVERFADRVFTLRRALDVAPVTPLTPREHAVLRLLPTLRSLEEIAEDLTVSANTVKTHVRAIYAKLGVTQRRDAVAVAFEHGLLENGRPQSR